MWHHLGLWGLGPSSLWAWCMQQNVNVNVTKVFTMLLSKLFHIVKFWSSSVIYYHFYNAKYYNLPAANQPYPAHFSAMFQVLAVCVGTTIIAWLIQGLIGRPMWSKRYKCLLTYHVLRQLPLSYLSADFKKGGRVSGGINHLFGVPSRRRLHLKVSCRNLSFLQQFPLVYSRHVAMAQGHSCYLFSKKEEGEIKVAFQVLDSCLFRQIWSSFV